MAQNVSIVAVIEEAGADPAAITPEPFEQIQAACEVIGQQYPDVRDPKTGELTDDRFEERSAAQTAAVQVILDSSHLTTVAAAKIRAAHAYRISLAALAGAIVAAEGSDEEVAQHTGVQHARVTSTRAGEPLRGYEVPG